jgi:hypothetical protein
MAITKSSSKTESWTIRIPIDLAEAARLKFSPGTGNTSIVIESIKALLGIDSTLSNTSPNTNLQLELDEIRSRLTTLEQTNISNQSILVLEPLTTPAVDQDWLDLATLAIRLNVKPKSITNAVRQRGEAIDDSTIKFNIGGKTIYKKIADQTTQYQIQ